MTEATDPIQPADPVQPTDPTGPSRPTGAGERARPGDPDGPALPAVLGARGGASFAGRLKGPDRIRIGLVVGAVLAIVVAGTVTLGASPSPSPAPGGNTPGKGRIERGGPFPFALRDRGLLGALGRRGDARGFGQITITAINGSNISLRTEDGWTRTISVTSSTTITRAGQKIALGDLKVGDTIRFGQTRNADGSFSITQIAVVLPRVAGTVTAVSASGFTVSKRDGTSWTVTVSSSTTYSVGRINPRSGSLADVKVGSEVVALGAQESGNTLDAITVRVGLATVAGQVTAKTGNTITVRRLDGTSATIHVDSGTTYRVRGTANAGLANVTVGMGILAEGTQRADGSLDATSVAAGQLRKPGRPFLPRFRGPNAVPSPTPPTPG
jgi:hypothetical protein